MIDDSVGAFAESFAIIFQLVLFTGFTVTDIRRDGRFYEDTNKKCDKQKKAFMAFRVDENRTNTVKSHRL